MSDFSGTPKSNPEDRAPVVHKGLVGVVVDETAISKVNPDSNSLLYRGYPVQELCATQTFEQVAYLLGEGELPDADQLAQLQHIEREARPLHPLVRRLIEDLPNSAHPMDVVRSAVSLLGAVDPLAQDNSVDAERQKSRTMWAQLPAIVAFTQRHRRGQQLIEPRDDLGYSENFLYQTFGEVPASVVVEAFDTSMILYAEHSFNASTFAARVVGSTLSDLHSAVTAGIGALKGPLHGGANEAVMHNFDEIGSAENTAAWLDAQMAQKNKVMGFGHRVYKSGDSRVPTMQSALEKLVAHYKRPDLLDLYMQLAEGMKARTKILPNLDYPAGPAYSLMGFDTDMFTPLFIAARVTGWSAHVMEQRTNNALIRPLSAYVGVSERHPQKA